MSSANFNTLLVILKKVCGHKTMCFSRVIFRLAHCLANNMYLFVFKNIYISVFYLSVFIYLYTYVCMYLLIIYVFYYYY